eukprot:scaffold45402_cov51-Phaeocystis_antarctica.AAC.1
MVDASGSNSRAYESQRKVEQPLVACDAVSIPGAGAEVAYGDGMNHPARINRLFRVQSSEFIRA